MKITDYGLWFFKSDTLDSNAWTKEPDENGKYQYIIFLNGIDIGSLWFGRPTILWKEPMTLAGVKYHHNLSAFREEDIGGDTVWRLSTNYVPTESDFEDLS